MPQPCTGSLEGELRILIPNNCSRGIFCCPLQLQVPKIVIKKEENPLLLLPISLLKIQHILGLKQEELFKLLSALFNLMATLRDNYCRKVQHLVEHGAAELSGKSSQATVLGLLSENRVNGGSKNTLSLLSQFWTSSSSKAKSLPQTS